MKIIHPCPWQGTIDIIQIMVTDIIMPYTIYKNADAGINKYYTFLLQFFASLYTKVIVLLPVKIIDRNNIKSFKRYSKT